MFIEGNLVAETVLIKDKINSSLEMNSAAVEFLEDVDKISEKDILIDFTGVIFVSRSFAQSYFSKKSKMDNNITEINISEGVKPLMDMISKKFNKI